jgi:Domain of unknown function (DUF4388)
MTECTANFGGMAHHLLACLAAGCQRLERASFLLCRPQKSWLFVATRVLILNPDPVFEDRLLSAFDYADETETRIVRTMAEVVAILIGESFDGFVIEGEPEFAIEAATVARQHFPSLKILCAPWQKGSADAARKAGQQNIPLINGARSTRQLQKELKRFLGSLDGHPEVSAEGIDPCHSLIGNLNQFSAAEVLQMTCMGQRSGRFTFKSGRGNSEIYLHQGEVRHAAYGTLDGEGALAEIFRWRQGRFYFEEGIISQEQSVNRPLAHLLLDNLQKFDETLQVATALPNQ